MSFPAPSWSNAGDITISNGIGESRTLNNSFVFSNLSLNRDVPVVTVVGRNGSRRSGPVTVNGRSFNISGVFLEATAAGAADEADNLEAFLSYGPLKVTRRGKYITCELESFSRSWSNEKVSEVTMEFVASDPFFYTSALTPYSFNYLGTSAGSSVNNPGLFPVEPVITMTVTSSGTVNSWFQMTNVTSGTSFKITDAFTLNNVYVLNCGDFILTRNGERKSSLVGVTFALNGFKFNKGTNNLSFTSGATLGMTISAPFSGRHFAP